uniref:Uncharacterized protein n=1 Tax=Quercus lobata TaxID=97700 RepID=A0A7N2N637_QUELO
MQGEGSEGGTNQQAWDKWSNDGTEQQVAKLMEEDFRQTRSASHAWKKKLEALDVLAIVKSRKEFSKAEWMCSSSSISGGVSG